MLDPDISTADALRHLSRPDAPGDDRFGLDRRRFLQLVGMGMGAGLVSGPGSSLLDLNLPGFDPSAWAAGPIGPSDGILVVIGMFGGNDGLNTVVPINDPQYREYRELAGYNASTAPGRRLFLTPDETLPIDAETGLNPNLSVLKRFWDANQLAIVEGVGHGLVEFSHFASMAWWMAGMNAGVPDTGWAGRWLDEYLGGSRDLYAAAEIGHALPLHLIGRSSVGTTVPVGQPAFGVPSPADAKLIAAVRELGGKSPSPWAGRIGGAQLDQLDLAATLSPVLPSNDALPQPEIVAKLNIAARLINANLGFRILTAGWADFDSHAGQPQMHGARMVELDRALDSFFATLDPAWGNRVTVMTFSEFGRTPHANDGEGSDHGSSAPHFVLGSNVKGGRYGQRPSLLQPGGAKMEAWDRMETTVLTQDYYGSIIEGWLGGDASSVVPGYSRNLGLFASGPNDQPSFPGQLVSDFVPINPTRIYDSRDATGGAPKRLGPGETIKIRVQGVNGVPDAGVRAVAVNISSIRPSETGAYLTAFPTGYARPYTATLNPRQGAVVPNMSIVGVGSDGTVSLYNFNGEVDVTVDLMGYFRQDVAARLTPLTPSRILDTRGAGRVRAGTTLELQITGQGGVPGSGVEGVVLNLTSVNPTTTGWITAWPTGEPKPFVANLSYLTGDIVPNMVMCKVGAGGTISLEASAGDLDLVADVVGCYTTDGARLSAVSPSRLLDTREGNGAPLAKLGQGAEIELQVTRRGGVPSNAKAVVLNVTGIRPERRTYLTIYPTGETRPLAASLNPDGGKIAGNLVIAKIGADGKVTIFNELGSLDVTADVTAYFI